MTIARTLVLSSALALNALPFHNLHATAVPSPIFTVDETADGRLDNRNVTLKCVINDVFLDELDTNYTYLVISGDKTSIYASVTTTSTFEHLKSLVGATVLLRGHCMCDPQPNRKHIGRRLADADTSDITVLKAPQRTPYAVPDISSVALSTPSEIANLGRRRSRGKVIATWKPNNILIKTIAGPILRAETSEGSLPAYGDSIEIVGFPETDIYRINLNRAIWRPCISLPIADPSVMPVSANKIRSNGNNQPSFNNTLHGKTIKVRGQILSLPRRGSSDTRLFMQSADVIIPVTTDPIEATLADLSPGCIIEVTGTCVMDIDNWRPNAIFPQIKGFFIVTRKPDDIQIIAYPPLWTSERLMIVIGALLALTLGSLSLNVILRRLAARKGRQLFNEQLGHVKADLRTEERTRLAVELHDTLAQNLTGVSMEIEAANDLRGDAPQAMLDHLGIAAKALKSCRDELRNCLWDLRSQALEEPDMAKAVLKTLQPIINDSRLAVRFNVPRARLSDNTTHALLRVIRELVINALRHGNASVVKVAGTIDRGQLLCSVTDNGCGFDPDAAPGILQGHFGLQGIQERIDEIGGTFEIASTPGTGTKATISIPIPHDA